MSAQFGKEVGLSKRSRSEKRLAFRSKESMYVDVRER